MKENSLAHGWGQWLRDIPARFGRPPSASPYLAHIDGLRFLAIATVLIWHIALRSSRYAEYWNHHGERIGNFYPLFPHGEIGVGLFFFISGFIISQPFLAKPRSEWKPLQFYSRRIRRIYPPYAVAVSLSFLIVLLSGYHNRRLSTENIFQSVASSLLFLHGAVFDRSSTIDPPLWSLEIEVQFYLLIPILLAIYLRSFATSPAFRLFLGSSLVVAAILTCSVIDYISPFDGRYRFGLLSHFYLFWSGVVIADYAHANPHSSIRRVPLYDVVFLFGLSLVVMLGLFLTRVDGKPGGGWPEILSDLCMTAACLALYFGSARGHLARKVMSNRWIGLIGTMCFSIYLIHIVVVEGLATVMLHRLRLHEALSVLGVHFLLSIPLALAAGSLFYVAVERPFMSGGGRAAREARIEPPTTPVGAL